jgi:hypothetical protein
MLRTIFEPDRKTVRGRRKNYIMRNFRICNFHAICCMDDQLKISICAGYKAHVGETRNAYTLIGNPEGKRKL